MLQADRAMVGTHMPRETDPDITLAPMPNPPPFRVGHGYDLHRLQSGGRLVLASVEVSTAISPVAHSDGDVVLHALV
ncbi:MAG: hypothetical protein JWO31_1982, partial [Phycisphaerales bacterium]|nr:hypothetical protein [Phycisphaerales bacterium]